MEFQKMHENPDVLHVGTCQNRSYFLPKAPEDGGRIHKSVPFERHMVVSVF